MVLKRSARIDWLDIMVTNRCNLRCSYCFHKKKNTDLSFNILKQAVIFLDEQFSDKVIFNFFGGEPLLRSDFCLECMRYLRAKYKNAIFCISTNGTIFSEKFVDFFLNDNKFNTLQLSYDGLNQNKNRCQDSLVIDNIKKYIKLIPSSNLNFRITFTRDDVSNLAENIVYLYSMGVRSITHHANISNDWTMEKIEIYRKQLDDIYEFLESHKDLRMRYCNYIQDYWDKDTPRCSMGNTLLALDCDGIIYPCHRLVGNDDLAIGDVNKQELNRGKLRVLELYKCENCEARRTCHPCMAANLEINGSLVEPVVSLCEMNRYEYIKLKPNLLKSDEAVKRICKASIVILEDICNSGYGKLRSL